MSIQLKVSNSLKSLSLELVAGIQRSDTIFRPVTVVTQTDGMNNWLKIRIAEELGIAANIHFLKPNDIIHILFQLLGGSYSQSISAHGLGWLLYKTLNSDNFIRKYPQVAAYYMEDGESEVRRMALAGKVADLLDQYQVYRTDGIAKWNKGENWDKNGGYTQRWQKALWLQSRSLAGDKFPDKTEVGHLILEALKNPEKVKLLSQKLPVVYFFGMSLMTQFHLEIIHALSKHIEVQFLIQNPAPDMYWYEDKPDRVIDFLKRKGILPKSEESFGHPLLVGWGKIIQDTFMMLFENEETLNNYSEIGVEEPPTDTLLHHIKNTIFNNQKEDIHFSSRQLNDGTITVNSCYSPIREVEVLYNYLVHLIDQKAEDLSARDIVVMVSDIDLYASYIKAVFNHAPYKFRYTIADESFSASDSISNTLMALLTLTEDQFTSEKVVGLLDYSEIRKHFRITDVEIIRKWVEQANIRLGISGSRDDDSVYISWKYGLKRMMYGMCMSGGKEFGEGNMSFYPLDCIEGANIMHATRFVYFVETLIQTLEERKHKRKIVDWVVYVEKNIQHFMGDSEESEDEEYSLLLKHLERYNLLQDIFTEEVSYDVFLYHFLPTLSETKRSSNFVTGGITFCSLVPMRSIPFKVVALLGMDFDKFPRQDKRVSFDLMRQSRERGDRNLKDNDKHLFLETLLSAEDYFYVSYIGQSVKDNGRLPPSALVDELVDFIGSKTEHAEAAKEKLVQLQPLHGFSPLYNMKDDRLYSYLIQDVNSEKKYLTEREEDGLSFEEIPVEDFLSFFKNPAKAFYRKALNIFYEEESLSLEESELFQLNHLQSWKLKKDLLIMADDNIDSFRIKAVKTGGLPLKNMSKVVVENTREDISFTKNIYTELVNGYEEKKVPIDLKIESVNLTGIVDGIFNNDLVRYSFSSHENRYTLQCYLGYLLLTAAGIEVDVKFISSNKVVKEGNKIAQDEAVIRLKKLLAIYKRGHKEILPFYSEIDTKKKDFEKEDMRGIQKKIIKYFENKYCDVYQKKAFESGIYQQDDSVKKYMELARVLLIPVEEFFGEKSK